MTTESPRHRSRSGPSIHVVRARKLLFGGLTGGVAAAIICLIVFTVLDGTKGLGSAALGAAMVLFFYAVGQLVMVAFADAGARTLMLVSMASYTGRVVILGVILMVISKNRDSWTGLNAITVFITTVAVVAGWLIVEVFVFSRLRIGIYDQEYEGPQQAAELEDATESSAGSPAESSAGTASGPAAGSAADQADDRPHPVSSPNGEGRP